MKYWISKLLPLVVIAGLLFGIAACGATPEPEVQPEPTQAVAEPTQPAEPEEEATEVFKLGILGPFSGPSARTGDEFKASVNMAFGDIGWQIGKYTIEPVWIDSQSDPAKAAQAYEQAVVQDGIQAGILNWHSSVAVSAMEITAKHKIPHFFGFGATEVVNETFASDPEKYGYWMFKGWPTPAKLAVSYVQALEDAIDSGIWSPAEKTVAIYGEDTDWGRSFGTAIKGQLEAAGWTTVGEEYFGIDQTEFYPLLNKFVDLNPAVIAGTSTAAPTMSARGRPAKPHHRRRPGLVRRVVRPDRQRLQLCSGPDSRLGHSRRQGVRRAIRGGARLPTQPFGRWLVLRR